MSFRKPNGFTLIELSLVAVIILILVGISTPLFRRTFYDMQFEETCYSIVKFMDYGRARAVSERLRTKFNLDMDAKKYWMTVNTDTERPDYFQSIEGRLGRFQAVPQQIELEAGDLLQGELSVIFYPNGRSQDFKLYLKNKNGKTKLIEVKKETGEALLSDYEE